MYLFLINFFRSIENRTIATTQKKTTTTTNFSKLNDIMNFFLFSLIFFLLSLNLVIAQTEISIDGKYKVVKSITK